MPIEGLVNLISAKIFQAYRRKSGVPFLKFMASIEKAVLAKALESSPSVVETAKTLKMKRTTYVQNGHL